MPLSYSKTYNYVFINQQPYYDSVTLDTICRFAEAGNTVFISSESLNGGFSDSILFDDYHLKLTTGYNGIYYKFIDSIIEPKKSSTFNFLHPDLRDKRGYDYYLLNKSDTLINYFYNFEAIADSEKRKPF